MKQAVKSLYVEIKRDEYEGLQSRAAELEAALNQAHMALAGYLPGHRNAITDAAIESAGSALKAQQPSGVAPDERAEFAAWVKREWPQAPLSRIRDLLPPNDPRYGEYCDERLQRAWVGWQARARLNASVVAVPDQAVTIPLDVAQWLFELLNKGGTHTLRGEPS